MAVIFVYIIHILCRFSVHAYYHGSDKGLTDVPHNEIPTNETEIYLNSNRISELHPNEFTNYTALTLLQIAHNNIHTISSSAFSGTQLIELDISSNKLTVAPDLAAVSGTLQTLTIKRNPLTAFSKHHNGWNWG